SACRSKSFRATRARRPRTSRRSREPVGPKVEKAPAGALFILGGSRAMAIDREQLLHVAHLARLQLREDEIDRLEDQLNDILEAVSKVSQLDLSDVPPTSHPLDVVNVWEADEPR